MRNTLAVGGASTLTGDVTMSGAATVGTTLGVTGATTLSNTLAVGGASTLTGDVTMSGAATVGTTLGVTQDVTIGTAGELNFAATDRQMINLGGTGFGIGTQADTTYFRSEGNFAFYENGAHSGTCLLYTSDAADE